MSKQVVSSPPLILKSSGRWIEWNREGKGWDRLDRLIDIPKRCVGNGSKCNSTVTHDSYKDRHGCSMLIPSI